MILYLDTSSLVKLYAEERFSTVVKEWVNDAEIVTTCRIAYPETHSAFYRRLKTGDVSLRDYRSLKSEFSREWETFVALDFDELEAGRMVEKHGLRGFDAVHLSAAMLLREHETTLALGFSSFDHKLNHAATKEGLMVLTPDGSSRNV